MTGSGKVSFTGIHSVFDVELQSDDIAFILIDFKGGDMARPFERHRIQVS